MLIIKLGISLNQRWYDWGSTVYIYISLRTTLTKGISIWLLISSSTPLVRPKSAIPPLLETTRVSDIIIWECPRLPNGGWGGGPAHHEKTPIRNHPSRYFVHCVCSLDWNARKFHIVNWQAIMIRWSVQKNCSYLFSIFFFGECVEYVLMFNAITM